MRSLIIVAFTAGVAGMTCTPSCLLAQQELTAEAVAALDMAAAPKLDTEGVRRVQRRLKAGGIDPGPVDGIVGPQTVEAVRAFKRRYGMKELGMIDNHFFFLIG